jgi:putative hydrolase of the HAD superfamily
MIRAVIFDCFGVLVSESWLAFKQRHFGDDAERAGEATNLMQQADAGLLSQRDFIHQIAELSGIPEDQVRHELDTNQPNAALFDYIQSELKPHYKIGMLSNVGGDWLHKLFSDEQVELFDALALSFETGITKPAEQAYITAADKLGVAVGECVFVDDQERHCTGAREAGMQAILFKSFEQARGELDKLLAK